MLKITVKLSLSIYIIYVLWNISNSIMLKKVKKNIQISQHKKTLTYKTQHTFVNHVNPTTMLYPVINGHVNT